MSDLIIVCSITSQKCFDRCLGEALKRIGADYKLILTSKYESLSQSYNSIIQTNREDIENSKYIVFVGQDVLIEANDWGTNLIQTLDKLVNLGYAGVDCIINTNKRGMIDGPSPPQPVECCDAGIIIIPSKLFLEHQFDIMFPWYPLAEDYAIWIKQVKHLNVYHIPIPGFKGGMNCSEKESRFRISFPGENEYNEFLKGEHFKLLEKWNKDSFETTTSKFRGHSQWSRSKYDYQVWKGKEQEKERKQGGKKMEDEKRFKYMGANRRGKVWAFQLSEDPTDELLIFFTPKGAVRGGDMHDHRQYNLVIRGQVKFFERFGPDMEVPKAGTISGQKETFLKEGQFGVFEPGIPHWFVALTDCIMLEFFELPRTKKGYAEYRDIIDAFERMLDQQETAPPA